jgi:molybdopterin converting factor small subunit
MKITLFGQLTDITGSSSIAVESVQDTDALVQAVNTLYPAMAGVKYIVAVNKKAVNSNTIINETSDLAFLPPFSGG